MAIVFNQLTKKSQSATESFIQFQRKISRYKNLHQNVIPGSINPKLLRYSQCYLLSDIYHNDKF